MLYLIELIEAVYFVRCEMDLARVANDIVRGSRIMKENQETEQHVAQTFSFIANNRGLSFNSSFLVVVLFFFFLCWDGPWLKQPVQ